MIRSVTSEGQVMGSMFNSTFFFGYFRRVGRIRLERSCFLNDQMLGMKSEIALMNYDLVFLSFWLILLFKFCLTRAGKDNEPIERDADRENWWRRLHEWSRQERHQQFRKLEQRNDFSILLFRCMIFDLYPPSVCWLVARFVFASMRALSWLKAEMSWLVNGLWQSAGTDRAWRL